MRVTAVGCLVTFGVSALTPLAGCATDPPFARALDASHGLDANGIDAGFGRLPDGAYVDAGPPPFDGAACGASRFDIAPTPPNVLILLDRSCSMQVTPSGARTTASSSTSKWAIAVRAIHGLTTRFAGLARWGLIYLPREGARTDGVMCSGTPVCGGTTSCPEVSPALGTGPAIDDVLAGISPFVGCPAGTQVMITPLDDGLLASAMVPELHDTTRADVVLLITDGEESCVSQARIVSDTAMLAASGIRTAVVGFGAAGSGGVNAAELNAIAMAGGIPSTGATQYYAATDAASLDTALDTIIGETLSCTFSLGSPPMRPDLLHVFVNATTELPRDPARASGWDYDAASDSVTLYGRACDDLRALRDAQLDVIEACSDGMVPPPVQCQHYGGPCTSDGDCCNLEGLVCDPMTMTCGVRAPA